MQLKKRGIRNKLTIATSTLLLGAPLQGYGSPEHLNISDAEPLKGHDFSISRLTYSEDGRVSVDKIHSKATAQLNERNTFRVDLIYDVITGPSPNGRIFTDNTASDTITFTTASGGSSTVNNTSAAANNKTWLSSPIEDTRKAANVEWEFKATPMLTTVLGAGGSSEDDYQSWSASANAIYEFNQRRTSVNVGAAVSNDTVEALIGIPDGLETLTCNNEAAIASSFRPTWLDCPVGRPTFFKPANKVVTDYIFGFTQVWNRRTVLQANYARGNESGYLTDPYKQISVVKSGFGETAVLYEKRPRARNTNSLFFKAVHVPLDNVSINFSYRYFWDDWEVRAHTADGRLRFNFNSKFYIQGHGRLHRQSAAYFFDRQIGVDPSSGSYYAEKPDFISADARLGKIISATAGIKMGYTWNRHIGFSARVENMQQHTYGVLPRLRVWITQLILKVKF